MQAYQEAVEHFLHALSFQAAGRGPSSGSPVMSEPIWSSLRLGLSMFGRRDLHPDVEAKNLDKLCAEFNVKLK